MSTHLPALTKCFKQNSCKPFETPHQLPRLENAYSPLLSFPPFQPSTHNICHGVTMVKKYAL